MPSFSLMYSLSWRKCPGTGSPCPCESESEVFHHELLRLPLESPILRGNSSQSFDIRRLAFLTSWINSRVGYKVYFTSTMLLRGPRCTSAVVDWSTLSALSSSRASSILRTLSCGRGD